MFPSCSPISTVWRAHKLGSAPWYFDDSIDGRFNLFSPRGTCYLADTMEAAARERLGPQFFESGYITEEDASKMVVSELTWPQNVKAADVLAPAAFRFHVSDELNTMIDYSVTQAWARSFDHAKFGGLHYRGRFSSSVGASWALFGGRGADDRLETDPAPRDGNDVCKRSGLVVKKFPTNTVGLTVLDP